MKKAFTLVLPAILLASLYACARAQASTETLTIPAGTKAQLVLRTPISSKLSDVDDRVIAELVEEITDKEGRVLLPARTEFIGRITQIQAARRLHRQASLAVVFEQVHLAQDIKPIRAVVTAIDDYASDRRMTAKNETGQIKGGRSARRTGKNVTTGATAGGLLGFVGWLSGAGYSSFPIGLNAGLAMGVVLTKGSEIRLGPETILRVRFEPALLQPASAKKTEEEKQ